MPGDGNARCPYCLGEGRLTVLIGLVLLDRGPRVRFEVDDLADGRTVRALGRYGVDDVVKGSVVQDATVHEPLVLHRGVARPVDEVPRNMFAGGRIVRRLRLPRSWVFLDRVEEAAEADRRKRSGKTCRGPGGKRQCRNIAEIGLEPLCRGQGFLLVRKAHQLPVRLVSM